MFSNSGKYAIRTVLYLSHNREEDKRFKVSELADSLSIPSPYLSKILQELSKKGLVSSVKGPKGGFYLSESNLKNTLLDIVLCMEGQDLFDKCILGLPECSGDNPCHLHDYYVRFKNDLKQVIEDVAIGES